mmetsp:Transcript_27318/g.30424  ORF Transcript_27318/g.30424 Transcript_27318/m.30424 type:complete len:254 (-) Transcript_27318:112-873(-)
MRALRSIQVQAQTHKRVAPTRKAVARYHVSVRSNAVTATVDKLFDTRTHYFRIPYNCTAEYWDKEDMRKGYEVVFQNPSAGAFALSYNRAVHDPASTLVKSTTELLKADINESVVQTFMAGDFRLLDFVKTARSADGGYIFREFEDKIAAIDKIANEAKDADNKERIQELASDPSIPSEFSAIYSRSSPAIQKYENEDEFTTPISKCNRPYNGKFRFPMTFEEYDQVLQRQAAAKLEDARKTLSGLKASFTED